MALLNIIKLVLTSDDVNLKKCLQKSIHILIVCLNHICTAMLAMFNGTCISLRAQEETCRQIHDTNCAQGRILDIS